jgi:membrane dipeptidase
MNEIHERPVIVECHNDLLLLIARARSIGKTNSLADRWVPALRKGGVNVQVLPISLDGEAEATLRKTILLIEYLHRETEAAADEVILCATGTEIDAAVAEGKIALVLALEGSQAVGGDIELFTTFFRLGVRMASFTWFGRTMLGDGSGEAAGGRLTSAGERAVGELEHLGVLLDISHLSEAGVEHVLELATRPVISSHSSARALCDHHRNLGDEQIRGIAATGGVIGINFFPAFIDPDQPTIDRVVDHIEHVANTAGLDHVGIGPDFVKEIVDELYPNQPDLRIEGLDPRATIAGLEGPQDLPALTEALLRRGFSEEDLKKILGANFLRVFRQVMGIPT